MKGTIAAATASGTKDLKRIPKIESACKVVTPAEPVFGRRYPIKSRASSPAGFAVQSGIQA
jgi:hypothetical protein